MRVPVIPAHGRWEQEDPDCSDITSDVVSSRPAWVTLDAFSINQLLSPNNNNKKTIPFTELFSPVHPFGIKLISLLHLHFYFVMVTLLLKHSINTKDEGEDGCVRVTGPHFVYGVYKSPSLMSQLKHTGCGDPE